MAENKELKMTLTSSSVEAKLIQYMTKYNLIDSLVRYGVIDACKTREEVKEWIQQAQLGDIDALLALINSENIVVVEASPEALSGSTEETSLVLKGGEVTESARTTSKAKTLAVKGSTFKADMSSVSGGAAFLFNVGGTDSEGQPAGGTVTVTDAVLTGEIGGKAGGFYVNTEGEVTFKNLVCDMAVYDAVGISNGSTKRPKKITFEGCKFNSNIGNCAINIFGCAENCEILIKDCYFKSASNPIRFNNDGKVSGVTITMENCKCDAWETELPYCGLLMLQDAVSTKEEAETNNIFGQEKLKVVFKNCTGPNGKISGELAEIIGSQTDKQVMYVYNKNGFVVYAEKPELYPDIVVE